MDQYRTLLLDVWREACRHIEIAESTANIAAMLQPFVPIQQLLVRRFDWERNVVETVATGMSDPASLPTEVRSECSAAQKRAVLAWSGEGRLLHVGHVSNVPDRETQAIAAGSIIPAGMKGAAVAGPLGEPGSPSGAVVLAGADGAAFEPRHLDLADLLL